MTEQRDNVYTLLEFWLQQHPECRSFTLVGVEIPSRFDSEAYYGANLTINDNGEVYVYEANSYRYIGTSLNTEQTAMIHACAKFIATLT